MSRRILFVHGAGEHTHELSKPLVAGYQSKLGADYAISFPRMPEAGDPDYRRWADAVLAELASFDDAAIVVGHSFGGTVLLTALTDHPKASNVRGVITMVAPFFGQGGWQFDISGPSDRIAGHFPETIPVSLLHGSADEVVSPDHVRLFAKAIPHADVQIFWKASITC